MEGSLSVQSPATCAAHVRAALQLSVMQIYSGQGAPMNRIGVQPDEAIELRLEDLQGGRDGQLDRATSYLREMAQQRNVASPRTGP